MNNTLLSVRFALLALVPLAGACGGGANRYQGMDAEALFILAETRAAEGDEDDAIAALDRLLLAYGDWPRVPEARLYLADLYFEKEEFLTARSEYQRFIDRYSGHASTPDAAIGVCRSLTALAPRPERDQTYTMEAMTACRNVAIDYAGLPQADEARQIGQELLDTLAEKEFKNADFYLRRGLRDSAVRYFDLVANSFPGTEWAHRALLQSYLINLDIGYDDLAEEARQRLLAEYPESESAAAVRGSGSER